MLKLVSLFFGRLGRIKTLPAGNYTVKIGDVKFADSFKTIKIKLELLNG